MISEQEARAAILGAVGPLPSRSALLTAALGCFAAQDLYARVPLPPFDNSAMDGYAVRAEDCRPAGQLRVIGEQPAGIDRGLKISSGETVRIFTGAPVPKGADAVVMQEEVSVDGELVSIQGEVRMGDYVRRGGSDLMPGQKILTRGERISAATLALLAAQGISEINIGAAPCAALVSTGDELVRPSDTLKPGQVYESNSVLLNALVQGCGAIVASAEHCADNPKDMESALRRGIENDALIISGGVSVGDLDLVKPALAAIGAKLDIWRVSVKPGKPFLFGRWGNCAIFGLPGNPVSAFVTFLLFVRPALLKMAGASESELAPATVRARLACEVANPGDRAHYMRGRVAHHIFEPTGRQESHALYSLSRANALLPVPPGGILPAGAEVEVLTW